MRRKKSKTVATRLPVEYIDRLEKAVKMSPYLTPAELLRAAVVKKINEIEEAEQSG